MKRPSHARPEKIPELAPFYCLLVLSGNYRERLSGAKGVAGLYRLAGFRGLARWNWLAGLKGGGMREHAGNEARASLSRTRSSRLGQKSKNRGANAVRGRHDLTTVRFTRLKQIVGIAGRHAVRRERSAI